eukprot:scaffold114887_cov45-Phaeocystis_antarctica.AAC.1
MDDHQAAAGRSRAGPPPRWCIAVHSPRASVRARGGFKLEFAVACSITPPGRDAGRSASY